MLASYKEKNVLLNKSGTTVKIKEGQFVTGRESFFRKMYPRKRKSNPHPITVWRWLEALKMMQNLHIETHNKYSIITIINWDIYQQTDEIFAQQNEDIMHPSCTQHAPIMHTIKNIKNNKNVKNNISANRRHKIPSDFSLTDNLVQIANKHGLNGDRIQTVFEHFKAHHESRGSAMLNWDKAWLTWVINDRKFNPQSKADSERDAWMKRHGLDPL